MIIVHRDLEHFQDICHQMTIFMIYGFPGVLFYALVWSGDGTLTATCRVLVNMDWLFRANPASARGTMLDILCSFHVRLTAVSRWLAVSVVLHKRIVHQSGTIIPILTDVHHYISLSELTVIDTDGWMDIDRNKIAEWRQDVANRCANRPKCPGKYREIYT